MDHPMPSTGDKIRDHCDNCGDEYTYVSGEDDHAHSGLCLSCYEFKESLDFISHDHRNALLRKVIERHDELAIYEDRTTFRVYEVGDDGE